MEILARLFSRALPIGILIVTQAVVDRASAQTPQRPAAVSAEQSEDGGGMEIQSKSGTGDVCVDGRYDGLAIAAPATGAGAGGAAGPGAAGARPQSTPVPEPQVGAVLYTESGSAPTLGTTKLYARYDLKFFLLNIDQNADGTLIYGLRTRGNVAYGQHFAVSAMNSDCGYEGEMKGSARKALPERSAQLKLNPDGTFHLSVGVRLEGQCNGSPLAFGYTIEGRSTKTAAGYVLQGTWTDSKTPHVNKSANYDLTLPFKGAGAAATGKCRYPNARRPTAAELQKMDPKARETASKSTSVDITDDSFEKVVAFFKTCGFKVVNAMDVGMMKGNELRGAGRVQVIWLQSTGLTYIEYD